MKVGLVEPHEEYPYGFSYLAKRKAAGAKQAAEKLGATANGAPASCRHALN